MKRIAIYLFSAVFGLVICSEIVQATYWIKAHISAGDLKSTSEPFYVNENEFITFSGENKSSLHKVFYYILNIDETNEETVVESGAIPCNAKVGQDIKVRPGNYKIFIQGYPKGPFGSVADGVLYKRPLKEFNTPLLPSYIIQMEGNQLLGNQIKLPSLTVVQSSS